MGEQAKIVVEVNDPKPKTRVVRVPAAPTRKFVTTMDSGKHHISSLDPVLTRKSATSHKGVLFLGAGCVLFICYVFNVGNMQTAMDGFFDRVNRAAQSENNVVTSTIIMVLPYVGAAILGLVVFALLRALFGGARNLNKNRRLSRRPTVSHDDFIEQAMSHKVCAKTAREAYILLLPYYGDQMRAELSDRLAEDLYLNRHDAINLYASLVRKSDRYLRSEAKEAPPVTVLELMLAVDQAPLRSATAHPPRPARGVRQRSMIRPSTWLKG